MSYSTPCDYCRKDPGVHPVEDGNVFLCNKCFKQVENADHNQFHLDMMRERPGDHLKNCLCKCPVCVLSRQGTPKSLIGAPLATQKEWARQ